MAQLSLPFVTLFFQFGMTDSKGQHLGSRGVKLIDGEALPTPIALDTESPPEPLPKTEATSAIATLTEQMATLTQEMQRLWSYVEKMNSQSESM